MVFSLQEQRYAVDLAVVDRVLPAGELIRVPKAPAVISGLLNVHGEVVPVVDLRRRFSLAVREMTVNDKLILARAGSRTVALLVDAVMEITDGAGGAPIPADHIVPGLEYIEGVLALEDGTILIHDLQACLSLEEKAQLDEAMRSVDGSLGS